MNSVLINFSGHTLNPQVVKRLQTLYGLLINASPVEIRFNDDVEKQIMIILENLPIKVDGSVPLTIIPPGQATFAILLVSYLHGLIGHFPNLCYLERSANGVYTPVAEYQIQPQELRAAARKFRYIQQAN